MAKFVLELKDGNTVEEVMSIDAKRQKELADLVTAEIKSTSPRTKPEIFQIICKHCQNLNELVYYIFCVGHKIGFDQAGQDGFMNLGRAPNGDLRLYITPPNES
jgi:hypothetical protein